MTQNKNTERFNVSLDPDVVDKAREKMEYLGGMLSPVINSLLICWILFREEVENLMKKSVEEWKKNGNGRFYTKRKRK